MHNNEVRARLSEELSFHIETLGCPKNKVDSRKMRSVLLRSGFREAKKVEKADFLLINSCSFIREAQEETIQTVFDALKIKEKKRPDLKVGLVGCFVERFSDAVHKDIPELDFTLGTQRYHEIPFLLSEKFNIELRAHFADSQWSFKPDEDAKHAYAWFRIAQGCDRHCAFCIIPTIRGKLLAYDETNLEKQWDDEKALRSDRPIREVILVSQDTISQGVENLEKIIAYYSQKDEVHWIRLQYLFPDKRVLALLDLWKKYPKLVAYLDIPFQHVSPEILKAMKRPMDVSLFGEIIHKARLVRPAMEIRTSFILGFPGETHEHVEAIKEGIESWRIDKLALFRYSHEVGTYAGDRYAETVTDEEKIRRINDVREKHLEVRKRFLTGLLGTREKMIVDEVHAGEVLLRREQDAPEVDEVVTAFTPQSPLSVGDLVETEITSFSEYALTGNIIAKR